MHDISLILTTTYKIVEIGLFENKSLVQEATIVNKNASRDLILTIANLLDKNQQHLTSLSFIAVNIGPGPFTTLRTVIATINGIAFATKIPLIGIDGLLALLDEYQGAFYPYSIALLNAFGGDVYYAIYKQPEKRIITGYQNTEHFFETLAHDIPVGDIQFFGGGVLLHEQQIKDMFGNRAHIDHPLPEQCSLEKIFQLAQKKWEEKKDLADELFPLYLKTFPVKTREL